MIGKLKIGFGIWLFLIFILLGGYRIIDLSVALSWVFAVFLHEMGHLFAARLCGADIKSFTLDVVGAKMTLCGKLLSYKEEILIAAAGPLTNLITAGLLSSFLGEFASFSMMLAILNLFPVFGFDGYRILFSFISLFFGDEIAASLMKKLSFLAIIIIWLLAVYLLLRFGAGFSAFILACSLFSSAIV